MKKSICILLIITMFSAILVSCGNAGNQAPSSISPSESSTPAPEQDVTELHWIAPGVGEKSWEGLIVPVLERYYEQTGVKIVSEHYAFNDLIELIEVKIGSGSTDYDILSVDAPLVSAYAKRGYLLPLDEFYSTDELNKYTDASVDAGSWDGKFYSPPFANSSQVLWYNTDLLAQAGVTIPENDENNRLTYEEIAQLSKDVLAVLDPNGTNGIFGFDFQQVGRTYQMNPLANSLGGLNISADGMSLKGVLDSEPWIKALTWYQTQINDKVSTRGISADELPNYFYSGKLVFMIGATYIGESAEANDMTTYDYTYLPAFEGHKDKVASATGSWNFGVNAATTKAAASAEFVKFITQGEGNDMWLDIRGEMPARKDKLQAIIDNPDSPRYLKIGAYEAINTAYPRALTPAYNEYSTIIDNLWADVRNGADINEVVNSSISQFESAAAKY